MNEYKDLLGTRYVPHGRCKDDGFDCYGLVIEVLKRNGITIPDLYYESLKPTAEFVKEFDEYTVKINQPEKNCLVEIYSLGNPGHIAVYIGDGLIIHTMLRSGVVIEPVSHYKHKIRGYYRVKN